ncbi:MAG: hypothetical protein Q9M28_01035 [Mariprofundaceae bacterium]|nr:hypothetical protein [Mariprofundaceae bacterium]
MMKNHINIPMFFSLFALVLISCHSSFAIASPQQVYQQAMQEAAHADVKVAQQRLQVAMSLLETRGLWYERMQAAERLLQMRLKVELTWQAMPPVYQGLAAAYTQQHAAPEASPQWLVGMLATLLPGSGHAYLGLWRDALSAALLVVPMLILTLWAARREMGPVTVFFFLITVWLWSGTVFSALSLAQRGSGEAYLLWWQGLWQATALPGQPW